MSILIRNTSKKKESIKKRNTTIYDKKKERKNKSVLTIKIQAPLTMSKTAKLLRFKKTTKNT
jgi:hypothetical protein